MAALRDSVVPSCADCLYTACTSEPHGAVAQGSPTSSCAQLCRNLTLEAFAGGFAEQRQEMIALGESVLKRLAEALCLVAAAISDFAESSSYTTHLLQSTAGEFLSDILQSCCLSMSLHEPR